MKTYFAFRHLAVCALFILAACARLHAQDVIYLTDNTNIKGKVTKVGSIEIEYLRAENISGPTYTIPRAQVLLISRVVVLYCQ